MRRFRSIAVCGSSSSTSSLLLSFSKYALLGTEGTINAAASSTAHNTINGTGQSKQPVKYAYAVKSVAATVIFGYFAFKSVYAVLFRIYRCRLKEEELLCIGVTFTVCGAGGTGQSKQPVKYAYAVKSVAATIPAANLPVPENSRATVGNVHRVRRRYVFIARRKFLSVFYSVRGGIFSSPYPLYRGACFCTLEFYFFACAAV